MKHRISYSIRPKEPGNEKKNSINEEKAVPTFNLEEFKRYPGEKTSQNSKKILKRLAVIGGGVTVGLIFGYALLQTFINPSTISPTGQVSQPTNGVVVSANMKEMSISFNEINVFLVQAGVFSSQESANKKATELKNKKQPAEVIQEDGKYIVYAGIASSRDEALSIAQFYRSENIPVMLKEKQIPSTSFTLQVPSGTNQDTITQLNTMSATEGELFQSLTVNASNGFGQTKSTANSPEKVTMLQETLKKQESILVGLLPETKNKPLQNSLNELNGAINAAKKNDLMQLQSYLLRFYKNEKEFRSGGTSS